MEPQKARYHLPLEATLSLLAVEVLVIRILVVQVLTEPIQFLDQLRQLAAVEVVLHPTVELMLVRQVALVVVLITLVLVELVLLAKVLLVVQHHQ